MKVTFRPQTHYPPEFSQRRLNSIFRAGWKDTLERLKFELRKLGAEEVVIEIAMEDKDIRLDGWPRGRATARHPGVIVSFESKHGPLRYGTDAFPSWEENIRAIALGLESLRRVDRYGIGSRGEQYRGWKALPSGNGESLLERGRKLIEAHGGVRAAQRATHPDTGGNADDFAAVQAAKGA